MVGQSKKPQILQRKHKLSKLKVSSVQLKKEIEKPLKVKKTKKVVDRSESETHQPEQKEQSVIATSTLPQLSAILPKKITTNYEVYESVNAVYSGGKISIHQNPDDKSKLNFFSSHNFNVVQSRYQNHRIHYDQERVIAHREEEIANFAVTNEGSQVITFTKNYMVRLCSLYDPIKIQWTQKVEPLFPIDMAVSPEDVFVGLGCTSGTIRIINVKKGTTSHEYRYHKGSVLKLAWHPVHRKLQLASAGDDQKINLFDLVSNSCLFSIQSHEARITSLNFIRGGQYLLSTSVDQHARLWDLAALKQVQGVKLEMDIESASVLNINKTEFIILGTLDGALHVASPDNLKNYVTHQLFEGQEILKIIPLKGREEIFIITSELHIYEVRPILQHGNLNFEIVQCSLGFNDEILDIKFESRIQNLTEPFDPKNERMALVTNSPFLKVIELQSMKIHSWKAHDDIIMCAQFIEGYILSGAKDNCMKLWRLSDVNVPELLAVYKGHTDNIVSAVLAPKDLSMIASVSNDNSLKLWDGIPKLQAKVEVQEITQSKRSVNAHEKDINVVKFSPNQKLLATSSQDRSIKIWNPDNLMMTMKLAGHKRGVWDVQFSPYEKILASASGDQTIKIWDLITGQIVHNLEGHLCSVLKVNWLCLGQILVSTDSNGMLKLWNLKKQICINTFEKHDGKVWALDVSPLAKNGTVYLATGGNDSTFHIWKDTTEETTQEQLQKNHQKQLRLQQFVNLMREQRFREAALLAFEANFTQHFIQAVQKLYEKIELEAQDQEEMKQLAKQLLSEQSMKFIDVLNSINRSVRTHHIAQVLFENGMRSCRVDDIVKKFSNKEDKQKMAQKIKYFAQISQKHKNRVQQNKKMSHVVEYCMLSQNVYI